MYRFLKTFEALYSLLFSRDTKTTIDTWCSVDPFTEFGQNSKLIVPHALEIQWHL